MAILPIVLKAKVSFDTINIKGIFSVMDFGDTMISSLKNINRALQLTRKE